MSDAKVSDFLAGIEASAPDKYSIVAAVRAMFHAANDKLSEEIKYGGLVFCTQEGLIGGIYVYQEHISVEFSGGATFDDPGGLLQGKGKHRRHIKLMEERDIETSHLQGFVQQATGN